MGTTDGLLLPKMHTKTNYINIIQNEISCLFSFFVFIINKENKIISQNVLIYFKTLND